MRTRRSPRNQQRLWKALTPPPGDSSHNHTCGDCVCFPKGWARGQCTLREMDVYARTEDMKCFQHRDANPSGLVIQIENGKPVVVATDAD